MTLIALPPAATFSSVEALTLRRMSNISRSKYTGKRQGLAFPFAVWYTELTFTEVNSNTAIGGQIRSFLAQLDGQVNTFRLPVPGYYRPLSGYTGNALVNGAVAVRAQSMSLDGFPANTAGILRHGDYFSLYDELKMVVGDASSDANGQLVVNFKPPARVAYADNAGVSFQNPTVLLCSQDDDAMSYALKPPFRQTVKGKFIEAFDL